ncbi:MAG: hypothetical protein ABI920_19275 [Casimicrobiaceae bacterium]
MIRAIPAFRAATSLALVLMAGGTFAADGGAQELKMETHAGFFSAETKQAKPLDPQVFVKDVNAPAATGPQNIRHDAGLRPAFIADAPGTALFNAKGKALGFDLGKWLAPTGTATIGPDGMTVTVKLANLRPQGTYTLFENHFDQKPVGFTPLDGTGKGNSFVAPADGTKTFTLKAPAKLTHDNAVLLVYHSDGATHGMSRGEIGVDAHHQMIARLP